MRRPRHLVLIVALAGLLGACGGPEEPSLGDPLAASPNVPATSTAGDVTDGATATVTDVTDVTDPPGGTQSGADLLADGTDHVAEIVAQRPHDTAAYTQGLEFDGARLYESRGQYGESAVTEIDPATGEVLRSRPLAEEYFAEGLTVVDGRIIQLTWREGTAFVYDADTLDPIGQFAYEGEGWGLCDDGTSLFMSDGTPVIERRDPATFEVLEEIPVTLDGIAVPRLNELECVDGMIWANVWTTTVVVVIDPTTGEVVAEIDATPLRVALGAAEGVGVLNGLALDPTTGAMLMTGKHWPAMFQVTFAPCEPGCVPDPRGLD